MSEINTRMPVLVRKYLADDLSEEESNELKQILQDPNLKKLFDQLIDHPWLGTQVQVMDQFDTEGSIQKIREAYPPAIPKATIPIWKYVAASAAALIIVMAFWLFLKNGDENGMLQLAEVHGNASKALFKTSDGLNIMLDEIGNGVVSYTGSGAIIKNGNQLLFPRTTLTTFSSANTVVTKRGGIFQIRLPDGSKVWLNSTSSIDFPTSFANNERTVSINGEVFFDIVKNPDKPFKVQAPNIQIQVTGTTFNIKAYKEDSVIRTTLFEGSVKVSDGKDIVYLKPGEEAVFGKKKKLEKKVLHRNAFEKVKAWQEGDFNFEDDDIREVITELGRWYDYDVVVPDSISDRRYTGVYKRSNSLTHILKYLKKLSDHKIEIEGKRIIVRPYN